MYFIGIAKDIHRLKHAKTNNVLGGYEFKSNHRIIAVSDGDVILHALADAILGASQNGDIGMYFHDNCPRCKNLDSKKILVKAISLAKALDILKYPALTTKLYTLCLITNEVVETF